MECRQSAKWVFVLLAPICFAALTGAGCPAFEGFLNGDGAAGFPVPTISENSVLLVVFNRSGEPVNVAARFVSVSQPVRETNLALTASGPESEAALLRTVADQIDVSVVVAGKAQLPVASARLTPGFVLFERSYLLGVDYQGGDTITVEIPFVGEDCNDNQVLDEDEVASGQALDCNSNGIPDECDVTLGVVADANINGVPDICENEAPIILNCPETIEIPADSSCSGVVPSVAPGLSVTDDFTPVAALSRSQQPAAGAPLSLGSDVIITVMIADAQGMSTTCDVRVTLVDESAPLLTPPPDVTIECDGSDSPDQTGMASVSDNCDPEPQVSFADELVPAEEGEDCPQSYAIERTWTAMDASGNISVGLQTITVQDTTPPVLLLPADTTIECDDSREPETTGLASTSDNCTESPQLTYEDGIRASCVDLARFRWPALHPCPAEIIDNPFPGDGGQQPLLSGTPGSACSIVVERMWTATDACGNSISAVQMITVADTTPPLLTAPADVVISCGSSTLPDDTGTAIAEDPCDPYVEVSYEDTSEGECPMLVTRTWYAVDLCGNESSAVQMITIEDMAPPALTLPPDVEVEIGDSTDPADTGTASAVDECDASPGISYADEFVPAGCPGEGTIERIWTATDACENAASDVQYIAVVMGEIGPRLYVDMSAYEGENDGSSWNDALMSLDAALELAACSDDVDEIWVAQGYYVPEVPGGRPGDARDATFAIPAGVAVLGSFRGCSDGDKCSPDDRDFVGTRTILSGDIGTTGSADNCYHVVTATGAGASLNGFTIIGGNADGAESRGLGGGLFVGGTGDVSLVHCAFYGNKASTGGAVGHTGVGFVNLTNCLVDGNTASGLGGGAYVSSDSGLLAINCTFASNMTDSITGGGGVATDGTCIVKNSVFWENESSSDSNLASQVLVSGAVPATVLYSCIQDNDPGAGDVPFGGAANGNIDENPMFVDRCGYDEVPGTMDDDLRVDFGSPCIDAADTSIVPSALAIDLWNASRVVDDPYTADTGVDSQNPPVVDMGAYEFQPPATDPRARVYWTIMSYQSGAVQSAKLDGADVQTHLSGEFGPADIVLDAVNERMYVRLSGEFNELVAADLDGGNRGTPVDDAGWGSDELAVDPVGGYIFWSESAYDGKDGPRGVIQRAAFDGTGRVPLVTTNEYESITGIAADPASDTLCWTRSGEDGHDLIVATLAGSDASSIYSSSFSLSDPEIEPPSGGRSLANVYWIKTDYQGGTSLIKKASVDGTGVTTIRSFDDDGPGAIAIDRVVGKIYWTEPGTGLIRRANTDGSNVETVLSGLGQVTGIAIYYPIVP